MNDVISHIEKSSNHQIDEGAGSIFERQTDYLRGNWSPLGNTRVRLH